ncbi:hypothetical protein BDZ97DRAFT_1822710 [Flammula alnicola]|nr:hypothetical protein BDZ97DRAFT_1822710 [Flammula alnicola]
MVTEQQLRASSQTFFDAFSSSIAPIKMLSYFSTTLPVTIQHTPAECPHPLTSRLDGSNAIRSYFDLLATHFTRSDARIRSAVQVNAESRRVTVIASVNWMWRKNLKIVTFVIRTDSGPATCVMRAVDADSPVIHCQEKTFAQASL